MMATFKAAQQQLQPGWHLQAKCGAAAKELPPWWKSLHDQALVQGVIKHGYGNWVAMCEVCVRCVCDHMRRRRRWERDELGLGRKACVHNSHWEWRWELGRRGVPDVQWYSFACMQAALPSFVIAPTNHTNSTTRYCCCCCCCCRMKTCPSSRPRRQQALTLTLLPRQLPSAAAKAAARAARLQQHHSQSGCRMPRPSPSAARAYSSPSNGC